MKFDYMIGNPTYNESSESGRFITSSSKNILHRILKECYNYCDNIVAIFPGRHLYDDIFIQDFDLNNSIKYLYLTENTNDIFNINNLLRGICYIHISKNKNKTKIIYKDLFNKIHNYDKLNKIGGGDTYNKIINKLNNNIQIGFKYKVKLGHKLNENINFGLKNILITDKNDKYKKKIIQMITDCIPIDSYGVAVSAVYNINSLHNHNTRAYSNINILPPNTCISSSFIVIYDIDTYDNAVKLANYLKTKLINFLIWYKRKVITLNASIIGNLPLTLDINDNNYAEYLKLTNEDVYNIDLYAKDVNSIKINDFCK